MRRHWIILSAACLAATAWDQRGSDRNGTGGPDAAPNVILVVSDGLRWQDVFMGADSTILFGAPAMLGDDPGSVRQKYWRATASERRAALMPFLWGTVAREGQLTGNRNLGSDVDVTNGRKFSYPGYNEMLVGAPDPRIDRNDFGPNPNVTVFEWLNRRSEFRGRVAAFGTWDTFRDIFNVGRSRIHIYTNGARPHDAVVQRVVLPYLTERNPRAVFVGFAETDDWGHEGRYDRYLDAMHAVDAYMAELWAVAQSRPEHRGKTTLIFTADHGRGRTPADWRHHGQDIPGAGETFIVTIGPETEARGERHDASHVLGDVAAATAAAVGLRYPVPVPAAAATAR